MTSAGRVQVWVSQLQNFAGEREGRRALENVCVLEAISPQSSGSHKLYTLTIMYCLRNRVDLLQLSW